jgi:hypothetical protein
MENRIYENNATLNKQFIRMLRDAVKDVIPIQPKGPDDDEDPDDKPEIDRLNDQLDAIRKQVEEQNNRLDRQRDRIKELKAQPIAEQTDRPEIDVNKVYDAIKDRLNERIDAIHEQVEQHTERLNRHRGTLKELNEQINAQPIVEQTDHSETFADIRTHMDDLDRKLHDLNLDTNIEGTNMKISNLDREVKQLQRDKEKKESVVGQLGDQVERLRVKINDFNDLYGNYYGRLEEDLGVLQENQTEGFKGFAKKRQVEEFNSRLQKFEQHLDRIDECYNQTQALNLRVERAEKNSERQLTLYEQQQNHGLDFAKQELLTLIETMRQSAEERNTVLKQQFQQQLAEHLAKIDELYEQIPAVNNSVQAMFQQTTQQMSLTWDGRMKEASTVITMVRSEIEQLENRYTNTVPKLTHDLEEEKKKRAELMAGMTHMIEQHVGQLAITMQGQVNDEIGKNMGSILTSISELKQRNDQLAITHDPGNLDERITDLLTPIREKVAQLEEHEEMVPGRFRPQEATDPVTLTTELIHTKDYTINEFINMLIQYFQGIYDINNHFLQSLMYKVHRRLEIEDFSTVKNITLYMLQRMASDKSEKSTKEEYFKLFLARLDVLIPWYAYAQDWLLYDPARQFNPYIDEFSQAESQIVIELGIYIENDAYIWAEKPDIANKYRSAWNITSEVTPLQSFGIPQVKDLFLAGQEFSAEELLENTRIKCFLGLLSQYVMRHNHCLFQMQRLGNDAQDRFVTKYPFFLRKWESYSFVKRWYFIVSDLIEEATPREDGYDLRIAFEGKPGFDYGAMLQHLGYISVMNWDDYVNDNLKKMKQNERAGFIKDAVNPIQRYFGWPEKQIVENPDFPAVDWTVDLPESREWG